MHPQCTSWKDNAGEVRSVSGGMKAPAGHDINSAHEDLKENDGTQATETQSCRTTDEKPRSVEPTTKRDAGKSKTRPVFKDL